MTVLGRDLIKVNDSMPIIIDEQVRIKIIKPQELFLQNIPNEIDLTTIPSTSNNTNLEYLPDEVNTPKTFNRVESSTRLSFKPSRETNSNNMLINKIRNLELGDEIMKV